MAEIRPFRAMMYSKKTGRDFKTLCCPPFDIISAEEQQRLYGANPYNAIYLELSPGEGEARYQNAARTLENWLSDGILEVQDRESLYVYEEEFTVRGEEYRLRGVIARVRIEEFERGVILPHEETRSKDKRDRFDLMTATGCNFSQVYSLYVDDEGQITPKMDAMAARQPDIEFTYSDGITHRLWNISDEALCAGYCAAFRENQLFIADGHHRYETALKYRDTLREKNGTAGGADYIMMMLVDIDHPGLVVLPTHRLLFGLENFVPDEFLAKINGDFAVKAVDTGSIDRVLESSGDASFVFYIKNCAYLLTLRDQNSSKSTLPHRSEAYRSLDVAVLHAMILEPYFGIDPANMAAGENLRYTHTTREAIAEVDAGGAQAAFIMNATRVRQVRDVALAGEKMPQKSTYFYPKIITGLVFNNFGY